MYFHIRINDKQVMAASFVQAHDEILSIRVNWKSGFEECIRMDFLFLFYLSFFFSVSNVSGFKN